MTNHMFSSQLTTDTLSPDVNFESLYEATICAPTCQGRFGPKSSDQGHHSFHCKVKPSPLDLRRTAVIEYRRTEENSLGRNRDRVTIAPTLALPKAVAADRRTCETSLERNHRKNLRCHLPNAFCHTSYAFPKRPCLYAEGWTNIKQ